MILNELFTPDLPIIRKSIIDIVVDAHASADWNELDRISDILSKTPYFDKNRQKRYLEFTTNAKELEDQISEAMYSDDYFPKRLLKKLQGETNAITNKHESMHEQG